MASKSKKPKLPEHELKVEYRKPGDLKPDPRNARTHDQKQIAQLMESIQQFGFTQPVLLRPNGMIGAGHGRVEAAKALGLKTIPTITVDLSEEKWRAYALADNAIPLNAGWNMDILREELGELTKTGVEGLGFDTLQGLLAPPEPSTLEPSDRERVNKSTVQYNIVFDDADQQQQWFAFLRNLKGKYPDVDSIGGRLVRHIMEVKL